MTRRTERATALLRPGNMSVTDVCMVVGCTSLGSSSARFIELVGETPSAYSARSHDEVRLGLHVKRWCGPACADAIPGAPKKAVLEKHGSRHPLRFGAMTVSLSAVQVYGDDPDAALGLYRDTLGLTVQNEVANGGFRWIMRVTDSQPGIGIVLSQRYAGRTREDGDALAALLAKGELPGPFFRADDLDATFDKIAATPGVEVLEEPADRFWGARDAAVRDPADNMFRIEQAS